MICLKQNTKWGWPHKTNCIISNHLSITSLVRSVALMSASRPNLSLGTQGYLPQSAQSSLRHHARSSSTSSSSSLKTQAAMEDTMTSARDAAIRPSTMATQFGGSSFNDGTTQTARDPLILGAGSHHLKVSTSAQTKAVALSHRYSRD